MTIWYLIDLHAGKAIPSHDEPVNPIPTGNMMHFPAVNLPLELYRCALGRVWGKMQRNCPSCGG